MPAMERAPSVLVEIAREFLVAYRRTCEVAALHRAGELSFDVVRGWAGDDDASALFRLKERCHALFRETGEHPEDGMAPAALFDLTVGALFHEAMRFRENFYQREIYGPRVRRLEGASPEEAELIREFDKILSGASVRLDEALQETEALLGQTRRQFRGLLAVNQEDGLVTRFLIENAGYVALVFDGGLEVLLAEVHGDAARGYALAARSYLDSGHFAEGARLLDDARRLGGDRPEWIRLGNYADAMNAYLEGAYADAVASLSAWLEKAPPPEEAPYALQALDAVSHLGRLAEGEEGERTAAAAERLAERLQSLAAPA